MVLLPDGFLVSFFATGFPEKPNSLRESEWKTISKVFLETGIETTRLAFCVVSGGSIQLFASPTLRA